MNADSGVIKDIMQLTKSEFLLARLTLSWSVANCGQSLDVYLEQFLSNMYTIAFF